jgi:hypothetical protein
MSTPKDGLEPENQFGAIQLYKCTFSFLSMLFHDIYLDYCAYTFSYDSLQHTAAR